MTTTTPNTTSIDKSTNTREDAIDTAVQFLAAADEAVANYFAEFYGGQLAAGQAAKAHPILVAEVMRAAMAIHLQTGKKRRKTG